MKQLIFQDIIFSMQIIRKIGDIKKARKIVNLALKESPRNLILNQYKIDADNFKKESIFDCKRKDHVAAEILYISANALSAQLIYPLSNFYLNLAKYLNEDFKVFDTLLAENFYKVENYSNAKEVYKK